MLTIINQQGPDELCKGLFTTGFDSFNLRPFALIFTVMNNIAILCSNWFHNTDSTNTSTINDSKSSTYSVKVCTRMDTQHALTTLRWTKLTQIQNHTASP